MLSSQNDILHINPEKHDDKCHKRIDLTHKAPLYVIAVISNPSRFTKRYTLFNEFCERMENENNVKLFAIELQQGSRPFETNSKIKLRTNDELWFKENLINLAVAHLPDDWEYMAWIDTDIEFQNKNWVRETIEQLQTYKIVQIFTHAIDLGSKGETLHVHIGFCYQYINGEEWKEPRYGGTWHPGYAWAIRKDTYDQIGGLIDFPILGSADHHMSLAFIGLGHKYLNNKLNNNYKLLCNIFQERCEKFVKRSIGYVHGTILHHFHGNKADRQYQDRWQILIKNDFDPLRDIIKNSRGLWQLEGSKIKLRDEIIRYFRQRNEDSIDMPMDYKYCKGKWI